MKRVLVTGASGFVGRRVVDRLLAQGIQTVAAVRGPRWIGSPQPGASPAMLGDVRNLSPHVSGGHFRDVDAVVHLAAHVHAPARRSVVNEAEFHSVNVLGAQRVAECAASAGVRRMVLVSSLHAMATHSRERLTPMTACQPTTAYGRSKLEAEHRLREIGARLGLEVVVLRPPPVYGRGHFGNLNLLFTAVRNGWPLPIGCAVGERSLVHVDNLAEAIVCCARRPEAADQTYLVSDGEPITLRELAETIGAAIQKKPMILPVPKTALRLAGLATGRRQLIDSLLASLAVDDRALRHDLGWQPIYSLEEGIRRTVHESADSPIMHESRAAA